MHPTLRPAATVVLARGSEGPPELLFVKRPKAMKFLAGFHAFPGGAVHEEDTDPRLLRRLDLSAEQMATRIGGTDPLSSAALFVCALRELFEEVGVLLVGSAKRPTGEQIAGARAKLIGGSMSFADVAEELDLTLQVSSLRFLARWAAPSALPVRFDARFFVCPYDGPIWPHQAEVEDAVWMSAERALGGAEAGDVLLAPPTVATLNAISRAKDLADLLAGSLDTKAGHFHQHSAQVRSLLAPNASVMTGPGTNTYVVGSREVLVIDPGSMERSHLEVLASSGRVVRILVTHRHGDHLSGALDLSDMTGAPVAASAKLWRAAGLGAGEVISDGDKIVAGDLVLEVIETPGHCADHLSFFFAAERALFAGDLILGEGTTVISPPDGNLADYLSSLRKVLQMSPSRIYPGHFRPRDDAMALIKWYTAHREMRHQQVLGAVADGANSVMQIVERVYEDTAKELHPVAARTVKAHLDLLLEQGAVSETGDGSWRIA